MRLLVILVCLGLERYLHVGHMLYRFQWFDAYLRKLNKSINNSQLMQGYLGILVIILPVLILVGLVFLLVHDRAYGLLSFIFSAVVFLYCLGPENIFLDAAKADADKFSAAQDANTNVQNLLWRANETLFGVLFWYAVLGPLGAVLYRMVFLLDQAAQPTDSAHHHLHSATSTVLGILDWLPVRLEAFAFALVGNFNKVISYWLEHVLSSWRENLNILIGCGYLAEGWQQGAILQQDETKAVLALIDRALIVFIVAIALFTIGSWLYFL